VEGSQTRLELFHHWMLLIPTRIPDTAAPGTTVCATGGTVKFVAEDAEDEPSQRSTEYEPGAMAGTVTGTVTVAETVPSLCTVEAFGFVAVAR
jgi:hypothetical protein